jgi:hypothetical protein
MLSVVMPSIFMQSVIILSVYMLSVIMLSVFMLRVMIQREISFQSQLSGSRARNRKVVQGSGTSINLSRVPFNYILYIKLVLANLINLSFH